MLFRSHLRLNRVRIGAEMIDFSMSKCIHFFRIRQTSRIHCRLKPIMASLWNINYSVDIEIEHSGWTIAHTQNDWQIYNNRQRNPNNSNQAKCAHRHMRLWLATKIERLKSEGVPSATKPWMRRHRYAHTNIPKRQWMICEGLHLDRLFTLGDILSPLLVMDAGY